jgi:hypothetical protein
VNTPLDPRFDFFVAAAKLKHFTFRELLVKVPTGTNGYSNPMPPVRLWDNIIPTAIVLDDLREELGVPITLNSGYRSPKYNAHIGGERHSEHMDFRALDFTPASGTPKEWAAQLRKMRGKQYRVPFRLQLSEVHAPFQSAGLNLHYVGDETVFTFQGGIGIYTSKNFVHVDTRGYEANWGS